jgi:hypothetical protein
VALLDQIEAELRAEGTGGRKALARHLVTAAAVTAVATGVLVMCALLTRSSELGLAAMAMWVTTMLLISRRLGHGPCAPRRAAGGRYPL